MCVYTVGPRIKPLDVAGSYHAEGGEGAVGRGRMREHGDQASGLEEGGRKKVENVSQFLTFS